MGDMTGSTEVHGTDHAEAQRPARTSLTGSDTRRQFIGATFAEVLTKLLGYVVLATLARVFSPSAMGELFFAIAFASIFGMLAEMGTGRYLIRRVAERPSDGLRDLSEVLSLRVPAAALGLLVLNGAALIFMPERATILFLTSVYVLVGDLYYVFGAFFVGLRRIRARVVTGLIEPSLLVVVVLLAVHAQWGLEAVLVGYVAAGLARVLVSAMAVRFMVGAFKPSPVPAAMGRVAKESFPFFLLAFLGLALLKVDTLMILFFRTPEEVAHYEGAYKFLEISRFAVRSASMVFFPRCAQLAAAGRWVELQHLIRRLFAVATAAGVLVGIAVLALAPVMVPLVWGDAYDPSIPVLRILFLGLPALYVTFIGTFVAQALRLERKAVTVLIAGITLNIGLNVVAIPRLGAEGAAWTSVGTELLLATSLAALVFSRVAAVRRDLPNASVAH